MEADVYTDDENIVGDVNDISGVALGNSDKENPAFPGALRLSTVQCFGKEGDKTMTFEEIKKAISDMNIHPSQLFNEDDIKNDRELGKVFVENSALKIEKDKHEKDYKKLKTESEEAIKKTDISEASARLDKLMGEEYTDKQKEFIKSRFNPSVLDDLSDKKLGEHLGLDDCPRWLNQVHGNVIVSAEEVVTPVSADGAITSASRVVCAVMTADCLPVLLCDDTGAHIAAVHGGWRGLAGGVIEAAIAAFVARGVDPRNILCWLGPAIGPGAYEVGQEVCDALHGGQDKDALTGNSAGRWHLDLYALARIRLRVCGVTQVFGGGYCTYTDSERFFSYRRDGVCGRQATLIWRQH